MGLDMYLNSKKQNKSVAYWRKANAIHKWFVDNVQNGVDDCGEYPVTKKNLEDLLDCVEQALDGPVSAAHYLPTTSGFFFGDTSYGQYYFEDLHSTKDMLEPLIASDDNFTYRSSW